MSYMLLIIEPPGQRRSRTAAEGRQAYTSMQRFSQELRDEGKLLAVESLASQSGAVRVQMRQGKTQLLDGPFAEAKEMVGGFFLIDCGSLDEAIDIARRCPAAEWATVEVRAVAPCCDDSHAPERSSP
ncbi:MAG: dehydrogenase [Proteobacteria bacterium]|jgi:hypothetical protein|nr:dehydrogenase [Pseudomonadota bacterium]